DVLELAILQREDGVGTPLRPVGRATARGHTSAPLVGEDDGTAVVAEGGGVPVGEVRVAHLVDAGRVGRVRDVEQDAVAAARASRQAEVRVRGDVVAVLGGGGALCVLAMAATAPQAGDVAGL